ncbi:Uu.00g055440.m01.CDS01 [Anthostomella pinea]|uniref:Uu.00g055440.m01.CDS01 n=1 Tax=Anthostomella pinea TaxID=933095 RepID=A0AAI8YPL5_9PEZI|nr:Uu.00g055440.m01.CDS01 [Anthostomella pinea]
MANEQNSETGATPSSNDVVYDSRRKYSPPTSCQLSIDAWWHITHANLSTGDIFRLSRVNQALWSLLLHRCSVLDAQSQASEFLQRPCALYTAIRQCRALSVIEVIVRAYVSVAPFLIEAPPSGSFWEPSLHLAVRINRFDVVDLLLRSHCDVNIRWSGPWGECPSGAHRSCGAARVRCRNALCVARLAGNEAMARFLLERGVEDYVPSGVAHVEHCMRCRVDLETLRFRTLMG